DIGPRGQELAELDIGRPQPVDRLGEALVAPGSPGAAPGEKPRDAPAEARQPGKLVARQGGDHALARHDPAGADQPEPGGDGAHDATPIVERSLTASSPNAARRCRRNSCAR